MTTGKEIVNKALGLLGYGENNGNLQLTQRILPKALPIVNLVYGDLAGICGIEKTSVKSLSESMELSDKAVTIFACGVAAYIAATEGDDNAQAFWSAEYQTRRTAFSKITEYKDVLPKNFF